VNRNTLQREGKRWVEENIITEEQLEQLLQRYPSRDPNQLLLIFAILLSGIGFLIFIFSDWAQQPYFSRIFIVLLVMTVLYIVGDYLYRNQSQAFGISFITLGFIVFGSGLFLALNNFNVLVTNPWPFIVWSIVGLLLFFVYNHPFLFVLSIVVTTVGQLYSGIVFSLFCWILFLVLLLGFGHFVYHRERELFSYLFGLSFLLQMIVLTTANELSFYWLLVFYLILYLLASIVPKSSLQVPLRYMSLLGIFLFNIYQTIVLQGDISFLDLSLELGFLIVWLLLFIGAVLIKVRKGEKYSYIDLILFLPIIYISSHSIVPLILIFVFSLAWLFIGYRVENNQKIILGTIAFLLSTFTAYIQFAWETMNKSLFFLVGGALLFLLSFLLEKQRRTIITTQDEEEGL